MMLPLPGLVLVAIKNISFLSVVSNPLPGKTVSRVLIGGMRNVVPLILFQEALHMAVRTCLSILLGLAATGVVFPTPCMAQSVIRPVLVSGAEPDVSEDNEDRDLFRPPLDTVEGLLMTRAVEPEPWETFQERLERADEIYSVALTAYNNEIAIVLAPESEPAEPDAALRELTYEQFALAIELRDLQQRLAELQILLQNLKDVRVEQQERLAELLQDINRERAGLQVQILEFLTLPAPPLKCDTIGKTGWSGWEQCALDSLDSCVDRRRELLRGSAFLEDDCFREMATFVEEFSVYVTRIHHIEAMAQSQLHFGDVYLPDVINELEQEIVKTEIQRHAVAAKFMISLDSRRIIVQAEAAQVVANQLSHEVEHQLVGAEQLYVALFHALGNYVGPLEPELLVRVCARIGVLRAALGFRDAPAWFNRAAATASDSAFYLVLTELPQERQSDLLAARIRLEGSPVATVRIRGRSDYSLYVDGEVIDKGPNSIILLPGEHRFEVVNTSGRVVQVISSVADENGSELWIDPDPCADWRRVNDTLYAAFLDFQLPEDVYRCLDTLGEYIHFVRVDEDPRGSNRREPPLTSLYYARACQRLSYSPSACPLVLHGSTSPGTMSIEMKRFATKYGWVLTGIGASLFLAGGASATVEYARASRDPIAALAEAQQGGSVYRSGALLSVVGLGLGLTGGTLLVSVSTDINLSLK